MERKVGSEKELQNNSGEQLFSQSSNADKPMVGLKSQVKHF